MKASVSIRQFLSWVLDSRVEEKLNNTCFIKLRGMAEFKCNNRFEGAIMSHFDENEFKFTFGEKSLYLGLEDVFHITGLPVDGCPVVVKKIDDYEKFSTRLLGSDDPERTENSPLVTKKWLLDTFKKVLDDITSVDEKLKWYVRAYILFTIGTILLPSNQKGTVSMVYLHHLEDLSVDSLNKIAWGAAVLAKLQGSFKNGKCTSGATWILEMFILERIPSIRDAYLYRRPTSTDEHPSCLMWSKFMKDNSHTSHSKIDWETSLNAIGDKILAFQKFLKFVPEKEENASGDNQNGGGSYTSNGPNCSLSNGDSSVNDHPKGTHDTGF
ncbi:uncharacterized protein [Euphorbia lathyris]|uniref:uncharacterized protein n=1 Tax=Euphorbia lathyris TaxID=212925 RepID=UPI003313EC6A